MDTVLVSDSPRTLRTPWMHSRSWDLSWLIGSVAIVPFVLLLVWAGVGNQWLNLGVTVLIGGPHLFSTYTATYMDGRFRRGHVAMLVAATILVPAFVVYFTLVDFQFLLSCFIFAASVHVLQQNAYLADIYRQRGKPAEPAWYRWIDYGFVGLSFYPIAAYKLVNGTFLLGDTQILIPGAFMQAWTYWFLGFAFAAVSALWIGKTLAEIRSGVVNVPKTVLLGVTAVAAFSVPMAAAGSRLELAFQAINAWHSFQYLGLIWLVQKKRKEMGLIDSPVIARVSGGGAKSWAFFGFCFACSSALLLIMVGLSAWNPLHITFEKYYYMCILSCLLIHYVLDGYLFTVSCVGKQSVKDNPYAALAAD